MPPRFPGAHWSAHLLVACHRRPLDVPLQHLIRVFSRCTLTSRSRSLNRHAPGRNTRRERMTMQCCGNLSDHHDDCPTCATRARCINCRLPNRSWRKDHRLPAWHRPQWACSCHPTGLSGVVPVMVDFCRFSIITQVERAFCAPAARTIVGKRRRAEPSFHQLRLPLCNLIRSDPAILYININAVRIDVLFALHVGGHGFVDLSRT